MTSRPVASSINARNTMRANRRVSGAELRLRSALRASGLRGYRVTSKLPGRPDIAIPKVRLAVFVHGCFWHRCPTCDLPAPRANAAFWAQKFAENIKRDRSVAARLVEAGWNPMVVWEHEIREDVEAVARRLSAIVTGGT